MDRKSESGDESAAKKRADARAALLVRVIFGGVIVVLIAVMAAISVYGERQTGGAAAPVDAADH